MGLTQEEDILVRREFSSVLMESKRRLSDEDKSLITKAFELANEAHSKMRRKSGEPYITHPIAVAKIVSSEIGLGAKSIASALLHDVVEDTDYTLKDIEQLFGPTIARIVDGLTKISDILDKDSSLQVENFRKMLMTITEDIRVIMIKLADRLHNMRTLASMPAYKRIKIASETMYLYAPIAHRLGLYAIKTELEDLALKYERPDVYQNIKDKIRETENERNESINDMIASMYELLNAHGIECSIKGRLKSVYSIWHKMETKGVAFNEIYDLYAIRIIFDKDNKLTGATEIRMACFNIMAIITEKYILNKDRTRDWITMPKSNGYTALHFTILNKKGQWVEVQVRTAKMDDLAEHGAASHWRYKTHDTNLNAGLDAFIENIKTMLADPDFNSFNSLDNLKLKMLSPEIYIFTPKGELKNLPKGYTVIDFAYDIHTEIGDHAIAANVNHKLKPLSYVLQSGDQVEILTSDKQTPQKEWLTFAKSARVKAALRAFQKDDYQYDSKKGQTLLEDIANEAKVKINQDILKELRLRYNTTSKEELYRKLASGEILADDVRKFIKKKRSTFARYWKLSINKPKSEINPDNTYVIDDATNSNFTFARCCNPIPGDDVAGFREDDNNIVIHQIDCKNLIRLAATQGNKVISVKWSRYKELSFPVKIVIKGSDQLGIVYHIVKLISQDANVNMRELKFDTKNGSFNGDIEMYIHNSHDLDDLISKLMKINGIEIVTRTNISEND